MPSTLPALYAHKFASRSNHQGSEGLTCVNVASLAQYFAIPAADLFLLTQNRIDRGYDGMAAREEVK